eukprot:2749778-Amphidinium_carterae.2
MQKTLNGSGASSALTWTQLSGIMKGQILPDLNSALLPAINANPGSQLGIRGRRKNLTLGEACDLIAAGRLAAAMDILVQRMKAIEMAAREGEGRQTASHYGVVSNV